MKAEYTCIVCPNGCEITATREEGQADYVIAGEGCKRGRAYVLQELTDPRRTISTSMRVEGGEMDLVSVRLSAPIPLAKISEAVQRIHEKTLQAPVKAGTVLIERILGYESDVIATRDVALATKGGR